MLDSENPQTIRTALRKRLPFEIVSSAFIAALLYFAIQKVDMKLLWLHITECLDRRLLLAIAVSFGVFVAHGLRLRLLIGSSFLTSYQIVNLGSILNVVLPFRLGDIARIYLCRRLYGISGKALLVAVVVEKFFDLSVVLLLALIAITSGALAIIPVTVVAVLACLLGIALVAFFVFQNSTAVAGLFALLPSRVEEQLVLLKDQLKLLNVRGIAIFTIVIWGINLACTYITFRMLLPDISFGVPDAITLTVVTALAVAIPGAPAGLGLFEAGLVAYLTQLHHVNAELALASALIFHAVIVLPPLVGVSVGMAKKLI